MSLLALSEGRTQQPGGALVMGSLLQRHELSFKEGVASGHSSNQVTLAAGSKDGESKGELGGRPAPA